MDYNTVRALLREAHSHLHTALIKGIALYDDLNRYSDEELCRMGLPPGYKIVDENTVHDPDGNPVSGYPTPAMWARLRSEAVAYFAVAAFLTNDSTRLAIPGVSGVDHWSFIAPNLPLGLWKRI